MVEVTELYIQMDVDSVEVIVAYILDYIYFPHVFRLKYGGAPGSVRIAWPTPRSAPES
jgi:hypothetical protein